jgi:hypothetical protein
MTHLPRTSETSHCTRPESSRMTSHCATLGCGIKVSVGNAVSIFREPCVNGLPCKTHSFRIYGSPDLSRDIGNRNIHSSVDTVTRTLVRGSIPDKGNILPLSTPIQTLRGRGGMYGCQRYICRGMKLDTRLHLVPR